MSKYTPLRGGGWVSIPVFLRSVRWGFLSPSESYYNVGFRLVLKKVNQGRPIRGGSWFYDDRDCLSSYRYDFSNPDSRFDVIGFRLILRRQHE